MAERATTVTADQFLEEFPLYSECMLRSGWGTPGKLSRICSTCKKETTWLLSADEVCSECRAYYPRALEYKCGLCEKQAVVFFVLIYNYSVEQQAHLSARKVGEFPQKAVRIAPQLQESLGSTKDFYSKALISYSQGYGIGALAYFRRVIEEKTIELIEIVADLAVQRGIPTENVEEIRSAKNEKSYTDKLKAASLAVPTSLKPEGHNPFGLLHDLLSEGLHARNEEECLEIAREIRQVFEYVFVNLRAQIESDKEFVRGVHKLLGKKSQS